VYEPGLDGVIHLPILLTSGCKKIREARPSFKESIGNNNILKKKEKSTELLKYEREKIVCY